MPDKPFYYQDNPDDPTEPLRQHGSQQKGQQGDKLVIGSFQDQPKRPERKPYQYPPRQAVDQPTAYQQPQQSASPGQQVSPGRMPGPAINRNANAQQYPYQQPGPTVNPNAQQYPYEQPGQMAGSAMPRKQRTPRRRRGCLIGCLVALLLLCVVGGFTAVTSQKVMAFGSAISTQSPLSSQTGYMGGSSRVNILLMGFGGSGHDGAYLTDSMVIMSLIPSSHHTTLISVPRDLWVQNPANSGAYTKLNAVYPVAAGNTNSDPVAGGNAVAQKVSLVTGLQVNYWMTVNFTGFKNFIDAIGGVDVNVPDSFNACYPKNDDASVDPSWIKIQFSKGLQHMNGATAIRYARAREPVEVCGMGTSENQAELSDFGRSRRQQLIMQAALVKMKQWQTWPHLFSALDTLKQTLYSNLSLADLGEFALKMDLQGAHRVGLTNNNVLVDTTASDGEAVLLPPNNNWQAIINYVRQQLYN
jgi:LCP family protein required for cell wall assembly